MLYPGRFILIVSVYPNFSSALFFEMNNREYLGHFDLKLKAMLNSTSLKVYPNSTDSWPSCRKFSHHKISLMDDDYK